MFGDVGGKLKGIAVVLFWVATIIDILLLFFSLGYLYGLEVEIASESVIVQQPTIFLYIILMLVFLAVCILKNYVIALLLYGYGILIDNSDISNEIETHIAKQNNEINNTLKEINNKISKKTE